VKRIEGICTNYNVALCYLFGSQQECGKAMLEGDPVEVTDIESDIDFGVLFASPPEDPLTIYAHLSLELQELVAPFRADLLLLHEVDHLMQLEVIRGTCIYSLSQEVKEAYEEKVVMMASDAVQVFKRNERDLFEAIDDGYFELEYKADRR
jgi:Polymerase beta, Nucleotidyltransferase